MRFCAHGTSGENRLDKLIAMTVFARVVEARGFSAGARALEMSPSAVSKQIARLEESLGVQLFYRSTRRVTLTEAGRAYHERCIRIFDEIADAEAATTALNAEPRGTLRIAATVSFGRVEILPRIDAFMRRHPELSIECELTDRHVDLVEDGIDVAVQWREQVDDPDIVARKLCVNRRIICAAPRYIRHHGMPQRPEDLRAHNCLTLSALDEFNDWAFEDADQGHRVLRVHGNFRANTVDGLYGAALAGLGVARLSTWLVAPDIEAGRLVPVLPDYRHDYSAFYILYPHRRHLSTKVRAFVDFLVDVFTPVPPWEATGGSDDPARAESGQGADD